MSWVAGRHLRARDGSAQPTTPVELLFDLVYVIAVTQLSHLVIGHDIHLAAIAQASFLLLVVWWAWIYTTWMVNWFDPVSGPVRLVLVLCGLASLMMSAALPEAFGTHAVLFAGSYVALQVGRNLAGMKLLERDHQLHDSFVRISAWSLVSGALWLAGALLGGAARIAWWGPALAVDLIAPATGYWLPFRGRLSAMEWPVEGGHFAERFQAFIIIALGESIAVTGLTAAGGSLRGQALLALVVAFLETGGLWWLYFGEIAERSRRYLAQAENVGVLARDAYTYLHVLIVAGIIMAAVGSDFLLAAPSREPAGPLIVMIVGGPALYLTGETLFRLRMVGSVSAKRIAAVVAILALAIPGPAISALTLTVLVTVVLTVLALAEYPPALARVRNVRGRTGG